MEPFKFFIVIYEKEPRERQGFKRTYIKANTLEELNKKIQEFINSKQK